MDMQILLSQKGAQFSKLEGQFMLGADGRRHASKRLAKGVILQGQKKGVVRWQLQAVKKTQCQRKEAHTEGKTEDLLPQEEGGASPGSVRRQLPSCKRRLRCEQLRASASSPDGRIGTLPHRLKEEAGGFVSELCTRENSALPRVLYNHKTSSNVSGSCVKHSFKTHIPTTEALSIGFPT